LERRTLADLDACRTAWEEAADPLALCAAVSQAAVPVWLRDALLAVLTDGVGLPPMLPRLWAQRTRDARDAIRARHFTKVRTFEIEGHPAFPWDDALRVAEALTHESVADLNHVSPALMKRAYQRVNQGVGAPGRYYKPVPGLAAEIHGAREQYVGTLQRALANRRKVDTSAG
jgi:hypothetical protein